ncbi:hypothetical protein Esti_005716 [Eimeria stiedai]
MMSVEEDKLSLLLLVAGYLQAYYVGAEDVAAPSEPLELDREVKADPEPEREPELERGQPPAFSTGPRATTPTATTTKAPPPTAALWVDATLSAFSTSQLQRTSHVCSANHPENPELKYTCFKSFLASQNGAEVVIPTEAVYQAANDYLSRNPLAKSADFTFGITVTDITGATDTAETKVKIALALEPPVLLSDSPAKSTISKEQSLDFVVTPQYCPHVAADYGSGVAFQWSVTCPNDLRTADQLLRLSSDGRTASVRPFSLTPGYTYTVTVALRYTSNASLSTSKSFAVSVKTEKIYIRFQYVIEKRQTGEEDLLPEPMK